MVPSTFGAKVTPLFTADRFQHDWPGPPVSDFLARATTTRSLRIALRHAAECRILNERGVCVLYIGGLHSAEDDSFTHDTRRRIADTCAATNHVVTTQTNRVAVL